MNNGVTSAIDPAGLSTWQWLKETALSLGYELLYVANTIDLTGLVSYYFLPNEFAFIDVFSPNILSRHNKIAQEVNSYYNRCFSFLDGKDVGNYITPQFNPALINLGTSNAVLGAIVGRGYLHISGFSSITKV